MSAIQTILTLDPAKTFNPAEFFGRGWSFWKGPIDGNGLEGEEDHDLENDTLTEVDFAKVVFDTCLNKGETGITGEEKLKRLQTIPGRIRLGVRVGAALCDDYHKNKDNSILEWLRRERQIRYLDFFGDALRHPDGRRRVFYLSYTIAWYMDMLQLDDGCWWGASRRSAGLDK